MSVLKIGDLSKLSVRIKTEISFRYLILKGKKLSFFHPSKYTWLHAIACNLSDNYLKFKSLGYEIIGVSADSEKLQKKFSDKFVLPYSLLCDENKDVINALKGLKKFMVKNTWVSIGPHL